MSSRASLSFSERATIAPAVGTTRTATILFADVVASTDTRTRIGDPAADWHWLRIEHALCAAIARADGRLIKTVGDGLIAAFESASTALDAAVDSMASVDHEPLRVGIATGDVAFVHHDVFGTPVVVAARLCAVARPNQILVTELVVDVAGSRTDVPAAWHGHLDLKGLRAPVTTMSIPWRPHNEREALDERPVPSTVEG